MQDASSMGPLWHPVTGLGSRERHWGKDWKVKGICGRDFLQLNGTRQLLSSPAFAESLGDASPPYPPQLGMQAGSRVVCVYTDYRGRAVVSGGWRLALPPLPCTVGISFSESFFSCCKNSNELCWDPLVVPSPAVRDPSGLHSKNKAEKAFRNIFSSLGEIPQWKPLSWSGRKPVVRTQRWSVNPEHPCQTEHCFPFHIPGLKQGFPSPLPHE